MAETEQEQIKMYYWNFRGLGHPLVYLLEYIGKPYELVLLDSKETYPDHIQKFKDSKTPFSNMPYIEHKGQLISESEAIAAHICIEAGRLDLLPKTENIVQYYQINGVLKDIFSNITSIVYISKSIENFKQNYEGILGRFERKGDELNEYLVGKKYVLGDSPTWLDFFFAETIEKVFEMEKLFELERWSAKAEFKRVLQNVYDLEQIKAYREKNQHGLLGSYWNGWSAIWRK